MSNWLPNNTYMKCVKNYHINGKISEMEESYTTIKKKCVRNTFYDLNGRIINSSIQDYDLIKENYNNNCYNCNNNYNNNNNNNNYDNNNNNYNNNYNNNNNNNQIQFSTSGNNVNCNDYNSNYYNNYLNEGPKMAFQNGNYYIATNNSHRQPIFGFVPGFGFLRFR